MDTKELKFEVPVPEGYEIDKEKSTFEKIVFKKKEIKLPKTWEEFCEKNPVKEGEVWFNEFSEIVEASSEESDRLVIEDKNNLPSKELAEAMLALCQLIQLRDCYNDGWVPDWNEYNKLKYVIENVRGDIETTTNGVVSRILAFKSSNLRDEFYKNFKDLIEIAKPLI